ncbi:MAG: hypothetical protein U0228_33015 [Myxococcaceae bacterium]
MKKWVLVALAVGGGLCVMCSGGVLLLGLFSDDSSTPGGPTSSTPRVASGDCSSTFQGWHQEIEPGGLVLTKGELVAELPWPFEYTNALREGNPSENVWRALLGDRYEPGAFEHGSYGEEWLGGPATEKASGKQVYISFTTGAQNGVINAVALIGDEATVRGQFHGVSPLLALQDLNRFSLGCTELGGTWKSGFATAAARYSASTGNFVGVEGVAGSLTLKLDGSNFTRESTGYVNKVYSKLVTSGSWSNDAWSVTLEPEGRDTVVYDAALLAVKNGFMLRLQDRKFSGDIDVLAKVE